MGSREVSNAPVPEAATDFGRRLRQFRGSKGMTVQKLADGAGMSLGYLRYLKQRVGRPSSGAVAQLAAVLGTSAAELPGADPGARAVRTHLVAIEPDRCWELLGEGGVGRVVFDSAAGPEALPVNFAAKNRSLYFRTGGGRLMASIPSDARLSLEVDHLDESRQQGWSVLVRGTCEHLGEDSDIEAVYGIDVEPWAKGDRNHWIRIRPLSVSGRVIEPAV
jgi:transcriptional regulator with XRE-family HTH domain